jgi:hypothetical protein
MKQTAVEWLEEKLKANPFRIENDKLWNQAKAMEKEQMYKCASFWRGKENEIEKPIFEQYYNETFKSE